MDVGQSTVIRWALRIVEFTRRKKEGVESMGNRRSEIRIMVVDDESDVTLFCKTVLEYYGFVVDTFNESKEVLSSFISNSYDLIILDIRMPDMDGFELYREIKVKDPSVRVCFLTASDRFYEEFRGRGCSTFDRVIYSTAY
jgi:DNA-binding response OmpR family regulator